MFRRSGSFGCYLVEGSVPAAAQPPFLAALAEHRFRSIEDAASEDGSSGWVTPGDPTGETFEAEDLDHEVGFWLRMRIDKKALPPKWVAIHRAQAERSRGRALTRRERQELNVDLQQKLLPRLLPAVNLVDALYVPGRRQVLLFATGKGVRDTFTALFHRTFDAVLLPADPHYLARSLASGRDAERYLEQVSPVRWPRAGGGGSRPAADPTAVPAEVGEHDFLGEEFLTWLWFRVETEGGDFELDGRTVAVALDDFLAFAPRAPDDTEQTLRKGLPTRTAEARSALRDGRRLRRAKLVVAEGSQQWSVVVDGPTMGLRSIRLPDDAEDATSPREKAVDRIGGFLAVWDLVGGLYRAFLRDRLREDYLATSGERQAQWMAREAPPRPVDGADEEAAAAAPWGDDRAAL